MRRNRNEKGNSYIEFVLVASFFFVPVILGMITVAIAVVRNFQVNQLTRDVGHMMAKGVDFSQQANQNLVANDLANGLSLQANSGNVTGSTTGNGVLVLSDFRELAVILRLRQRRPCGGGDPDRHRQQYALHQPVREPRFHRADIRKRGQLYRPIQARRRTMSRTSSPSHPAVWPTWRKVTFAFTRLGRRGVHHQSGRVQPLRVLAKCKR